MSLTRLTQLLAATLLMLVGTQAANAKEIHWGGCGISKLGFMQDLAKAYESKTGIKIHLEGGGATKGLRRTASGELDLGGSCRLPLTHMEDGSKVVEPHEMRIKTIPVGWDALVVVTHPYNPIDSISSDQLRDVLTGKITNWQQLGGEDKAINLYVRRGKISGVGLTLRQQLFNNRDQQFSDRASILPSSGKIEKAIEQDPYGLAVSGISSSRHRALKLLKLDGITPSIATLDSGDYPLMRILFLVAPKDYHERDELNEFVRFAHSAKGQRIIRDAGTLPFHQGVHLLFTAASQEYLHNIDVVEQAGIYTLSGN